MGNNNWSRAFCSGIASNAVWEWLKAIGGGLVSALVTAMTQYLRHRPIDWWGLLALGIITTIVVGLILNRERHSAILKGSDLQSATKLNDSQVPQSPEELREQVIDLAGGLCGFLIGYGEPLEPPHVDDGFAGLGTVPDDPEIRDDFTAKFGHRVAEIKKRLGDLSLLSEEAEFTSIGNVLATQVRNAEDVRSIIRALDVAKKAIDEKCLHGTPFAFAGSPVKPAISPARKPLFSPLQMEAFRLAKDLVSLSRKAQGSTLSEFIVNKLMPDPNVNEWQRIAVSEYALDFAPRLKNLTLRFDKEGINEPELEQYFDSIPNAQCLPSIQGSVVRLAFKMDGIKVRPE